MSSDKKEASLSEQLKMQRMYNQKILESKSEKELLEDKLKQSKEQLKKAKKKPTIKKEG